MEEINLVLQFTITEQTNLSSEYRLWAFCNGCLWLWLSNRSNICVSVQVWHNIYLNLKSWVLVDDCANRLHFFIPYGATGAFETSLGGCKTSQFSDCFLFYFYLNLNNINNIIMEIFLFFLNRCFKQLKIINKLKYIYKEKGST